MYKLGLERLSNIDFYFLRCDNTNAVMIDQRRDDGD